MFQKLGLVVCLKMTSRILSVLSCLKICLLSNFREDIFNSLVTAHYSEDLLFGLGFGVRFRVRVRVRIAYLRNSRPSE